MVWARNDRDHSGRAEAADQSLALYRILAGEPKDFGDYRRAMAAEGRLVYEFAIHKAYGMNSNPEWLD